MIKPLQLDIKLTEYGDWGELPIKYLIVSSKDFIVFIDYENDIDWKTSDQYDSIQLSASDLKHLNQIKNQAANLEGIPCNELEEKIIINFKRQIGESLVRAFEGDYDSAENMLSLAKEYIVNRNVEQSRYMYLASSGIFTVANILISILIWLLRSPIIQFTGINVFYLIMSFFAGAVGAFLSIILRIGKTTLDYNARRKLHYLEAISRVFAGMISAVLIGLCISAQIILPIFSKIESTHVAMILGGLVAGASERLAPSIITKLDGNKNE